MNCPVADLNAVIRLENKLNKLLENQSLGDSKKCRHLSSLLKQLKLNTLYLHDQVTTCLTCFGLPHFVLENIRRTEPLHLQLVLWTPDVRRWLSQVRKFPGQFGISVMPLRRKRNSNAVVKVSIVVSSMKTLLSLENHDATRAICTYDKETELPVVFYTNTLEEIGTNPRCTMIVRVLTWSRACKGVVCKPPSETKISNIVQG